MRRPLHRFGLFGLLSLMYIGVVLAFSKLRPDLDGLPPLWVALYCAAWLAGFLSLGWIALVPAGVAERCTSMAMTAYERTGCRDIARVDIMLDKTGQPWFLEINTMPGFTPTSMFPLMWAATGLEYPKVVDRLIRTALHRGTGLH